jgi:FMN reductase
MAEPFQPLILGLGGAARGSGSSSETALRFALKSAEALGVRTRLLGGAFLARLPLYSPEAQVRTPEEAELVEAVREADGLIVATPGYHGGMSGLVKNAIDLIEDTRGDERVYLDGRAVGLIVTANGWQATGATLVSLRSVVHALRGWPTPLGVALNATVSLFDEDGTPKEAAAAGSLALMAGQVVQFARCWRSA